MSASLLSARASHAAIAAVIVLAGAAFTREASAAGGPGAQWYVELSGTSCQSQRADFEREITLACAAVGNTCRVASSPKDAELRAILDCSGPEGSWTLETRTIEGAVLEKIDLGGVPADRLRQAAVEVARDAAPERALAIETLRFTLANEEPVHFKHPGEKLTLAVGGRASATTDRAPTRGGAHVLGGLALSRTVRATLGVVAEAGGSGERAMRGFRSGPGIAVGAPFDATAPIGAAAEVGLGVTTQYGAFTSSDAGRALPTYTSVAGYGQCTITVQWPRAGVRPYAALSVAAMSNGTPLLATGEAGLALAVF